MSDKIKNSKIKGLIDDLIGSEVPFSSIVDFALKHGEVLTVEELEDYSSTDFFPEDELAYKVARRREKIRKTDQAYENGHVALQNAVNTLNHVLEQVMERWKLLLDTKKEANIKEKDLLGYVSQIHGLAKTVHELNSSIKDDNYIPIHIFYEEVERFIGMTIGFLNEFEKENPGLFLKDKFLGRVKEKFSRLELAAPTAIEEEERRYL